MMWKRRRKLLVPLAALLAALLIGAFLIRARVSPLVEQAALEAVSDAASDRINRAVLDQISRGEIQYDRLITLEKDDSGGITALTTNIREINRLKTQLLAKLDQEIRTIDENELEIPLGSLTGAELLSGRGPGIPVRIVSVASSDASFRSTFSEAGINQTLHRIMLEVSMDLVVLLPTGPVRDRVNTEVCVAETVLLGRVPGNYTYFAGENGAVYIPAE